ncbi:MAG TPA: VOC family protein [Thermomicrobiales bacterium]|nr:VOC family protein [Thermomicrobiales bacterium]
MSTEIPRRSATHRFVAEPGQSTPIGDSGTILPEPRPVRLTAVNHIAIRVNDLFKAEQFYTDFFGMELAGRAFRTDRGGYRAVPASYDPVRARRDFQEADVSFLESEALTLALRRVGRGDRIETNAILDHISVDVDVRAFAELRAAVLLRNFDVLMLAPEALTFRDPFGVVWEVTIDEIGTHPAGI